MSPPEQLAGVAATFEETGVDSLWLGEYFQAALVRAAVVAMATSRVTVGTHVLQAFARSPLATTLAAEDLQAVAGGRFVLGLGSQVPAANQRWHGVESPRPVAMLEEYVAAVRHLLGAPGDQRVRFGGHTFRYDVPGFRPLRTEPPSPVLIGGAGPGTVRAAAAVADGLLGHLLWTPDYVRDRVRPVVAGLGRADFPVTIARLAAPSTVPGWELDAARRLAHYAITPAYQPLLDATGMTIDRAAVLAALRESATDGLLELTRPLLGPYCVHDAAGLRTQLAAAGAAGIDTVILFVPSSPGVGGDAAAYERALTELVGEVLNRTPATTASGAS